MAKRCPRLARFGFSNYNFSTLSQAFTDIGRGLVSLRLDDLALKDSNCCYNLVIGLSKMLRLEKLVLIFYTGTPKLDEAIVEKFKSKTFQDNLILRKLTIRNSCNRKEGGSCRQTLG